MLDEAFHKDQVTLLLYLETRAVDHGGVVDIDHMNNDDVMQAKLWADSRYIGFGRIRAPVFGHWVELSDEAWDDAHRFRRERAARMLANRTWEKTSERASGEPDN
jgi:hypothetical protein